MHLWFARNELHSSTSTALQPYVCMSGQTSIRWASGLFLRTIRMHLWFARYELHSSTSTALLSYVCTYDMTALTTVETFVCLINTTKIRFQNVCYNIGTYVGEYQLHSGLLVDKRPKTFWHEVVINGKLMNLDLDQI